MKIVGDSQVLQQFIFEYQILIFKVAISFETLVNFFSFYGKPMLILWKNVISLLLQGTQHCTVTSFQYFLTFK